MFKSILRDRLLLTLAAVAIFIKLFSLNPAWVERYYTFGLYPVVSTILRTLFGWIPFSFGDIFYFAAFILLVVKSWKFISLLAKRKVKTYLSWILFRKYLKLVLWIYIIFNLFWGLNYNRQGIAEQFGLEIGKYNVAELNSLAKTLQDKLNYYAGQVDSIKRLSLNSNKTLFSEGVRAYDRVSKQYPFLTYKQASIKPSIFASIGHYFGFTGYYNPFSGEAQLKTSVPVFIKPFVVCHEIGHQLGYAKENEANFSSFLAGRASENVEFRYSVYYDMYSYAIGELLFYNVSCVIDLRKSEHPQIKEDRRTFIQYLSRHKNNIEPFMSGVYDRYLRLNNQPKGKETYNEVVSWLIAYRKKYGNSAL